jgi:phosphate transport system permease protein
MSVLSDRKTLRASPLRAERPIGLVPWLRHLVERDRVRRNTSIFAGWLLGLISLLIVLLVPFLVTITGAKALPLFSTITPDNLLGQTWNPARNAFGLTPFILGSLWLTFIAMLIAVPLSLFSAVYLSEYVKPKHRNILRPLIELLAGIPSVVYGLWGLVVIVPLISQLARATKADNATGYSVLSGALVLALMVTPFMVALMEEVIRMTPRGMSNAALAMGATKWEVVRDVLFRHSRAGLVAAAGLGFARAVGETLAVLMVVGNVAKMPGSLFSPAYPLPALIANNFGEMMSSPLYYSAMMVAALILLALVLAFNLGSRLIINRMAHHDR